MNRSATLVLLSAQEVSKGFGSQPVLEDISLSLHEGERLGLIGRNGSGKSTLLHLLAGLDEPDSGVVTRRTGARVALLSQECRLPRSITVREALERATQPLRDLAAKHVELSDRLNEPGLTGSQRGALVEEFEHVDHEARLHNAWGVDAETDRVAAALGLPESDRILDTLSGGELRRVDLAATLLAEPDVLLLDEPTNHIDTESARWIETFLARYKGSCILVTHDRYFLDRVVTRIAEIDGRRLLTFPGNYERFLEYKTQVEAIEAKTETNRQAELKRELAWLRRGPKARGTKQKARIQRYEELADHEARIPDAELVFEIPQPRRLGKRVIEAERIAAEKGGRVLFDDLTVILQAGMRVGIAGPNGCGKTSLLRVLMGEEPPSRGSVFIGDSVDFLYAGQTHEDIDLNESVLEYVSGGANYWDVDKRRIYVPGYLERLLFDMDSVRSPIRNLSGGERNRMVLAKQLLRGGNVLALDEPTNDLDLATLRVLEEAVIAFDGCALVVSHDRYFLNRVATHMIVFEPGVPLYFSAGNYDDYLVYCEKRDAERRRETAPTTPARGAPVRPDRPTVGKPRRLTYKEKEELDAMESTIETVEQEIASLEDTINAPGFYQRPHEEVQTTLNALSSKKEASEALYQRWEELESRAGIK